MADDRPLVAVTFRLGRDQLAELFGDEVRAEAVVELPEEERARTLAAADALLVWDWRREFHPDEGPTLGTRFVQLLSAGADQLPFDQLPPKAVIASNVGAYAEPMAEHALAMTAFGGSWSKGSWSAPAINTSGRTDEPVDFVGTL